MHTKISVKIYFDFIRNIILFQCGSYLLFILLCISLLHDLSCLLSTLFSNSKGLWFTLISGSLFSIRGETRDRCELYDVVNQCRRYLIIKCCLTCQSANLYFILARDIYIVIFQQRAGFSGSTDWCVSVAFRRRGIT